jgi:VWFA-related protein
VDVIDSYLVNVEVWVTDSKGRPITGLAQSDFEIREDGEIVEASHFREVRGTESDGRAHRLESAAPAESAATVAIGDEQAHLVFYFDLVHLSRAGHSQIMEDLRRFLASGSIEPGRVMLLKQSSAGLVAVAPFGSNQAHLETGLDALAAEKPRGNEPEFDKRLALKRMELIWEDEKRKPGDPCVRFPRRALAEVEQYAQQRREQISPSLALLGDTAAYLSAVPGMKTLVYLGDRLETAPGRGLLTFIDALCPPARRDRTPLDISTDLISPFESLTRHANANRVTIYAFQTSGLRANFLMSAEMSNTDLVAGGGRIDFAMRSSERAGLSFLATQTGGRAEFSRNRFDKELTRLAAEMSSYYSLAYVPPHGGDGRQHKIEVEVRRESARDGGGGKNLVVRHRRSYVDKSSDERMSERLQGAVHLGLVSNPLDVRLAAGALEARQGDRYLLPLHVMVPAERVVFLPDGTEERAQLELVVTAYSEKKLVGSAHETFRIPRPATSEEKTLDLVMNVEIGAGRHLLAVGLRDRASLEASYVSTSVEVGAAAAAEPGSSP